MVTAFIVGVAFPVVVGFIIKAAFNYTDHKKSLRQAVINVR